MIVLSILTALALEQAVLGIEHHHQGERARHEIEQEIEANRHAVQESLAATRGYAKGWDEMLARTVAQVNAGQSTNESLLATIEEARHHFGIESQLAQIDQAMRVALDAATPSEPVSGATSAPAAASR